MALDPANKTWRDESTADDDAAITLVPADEVEARAMLHIQIFNRGADDALFSVDGGKSYQEIPADVVITLDGIHISGAVLFKRIPAAADPAGPTSGRVW